MADATIDDVRELIDTDLDDIDIQNILDRVSREVGREYGDEDFKDEYHRADLEAAIAALRIVTGPERQARQIQLGNAMKTYNSSDVDWLRDLIRRLDPASAFSVGVRRDSDRHIRSANNDTDSSSGSGSGSDTA